MLAAILAYVSFLSCQWFWLLAFTSISVAYVIVTVRRVRERR